MNTVYITLFVLLIASLFTSLLLLTSASIPGVERFQVSPASLLGELCVRFATWDNLKGRKTKVPKYIYKNAELILAVPSVNQHMPKLLLVWAIN